MKISRITVCYEPLGKKMLGAKSKGDSIRNKGGSSTKHNYAMNLLVKNFWGPKKGGGAPTEIRGGGVQPPEPPPPNSYNPDYNSHLKLDQKTLCKHVLDGLQVNDVEDSMISVLGCCCCCIDWHTCADLLCFLNALVMS